MICYLEDYKGFESLIENIKDFNNDVKFEPYSKNFADNHINIRIVLGSYNFVNRVVSSVNFNSKDSFIPTLIDVINHWKGILQAFGNEEDLKNPYNSINISGYSGDATLHSRQNHISKE